MIPLKPSNACRRAQVNHGGLLQPPKQPWKCCVCAQLRCSGRVGTGEKRGLGWRSGNSTTGAAVAALLLPLHDSLDHHAFASVCTDSAVLMNDASQPHSRIRHLNCLLVDHRVSNKHVSGRNSGPIPPVFEPIRSTSRTTKFFDKFVGYRCIVASHHLLFRQGLVMGTVTSTHQSLLLLRINS